MNKKRKKEIGSYRAREYMYMYIKRVEGQETREIKTASRRETRLS